MNIKFINWAILLLILASCKSTNEKQISHLLPEEFTVALEDNTQYGIPTICKIYLINKQIENQSILRQYPVEVKEDGWLFRKWHIIENNTEKRNVIAMLELAEYPFTINNEVNKFTKIIKSVKSSIENQTGYASYYYRKPNKDSGYYEDGYIEFYYLEPGKRRIIYLSFGDI